VNSFNQLLFFYYSKFFRCCILKTNFLSHVFFEALLREWNIVSSPVEISISLTSFPFLCFLSLLNFLACSNKPFYFIISSIYFLFMCVRPLVSACNRSIIAGLVIIWAVAIYIIENFSLKVKNSFIFFEIFPLQI